MSANAGAGREDIHAGMLIGNPDQLPHIQLRNVANTRQFVRKSNIEVPVGVLRNLAHFREANTGQRNVAPAKRGVQLPDTFSHFL